MLIKILALFAIGAIKCVFAYQMTMYIIGDEKLAKLAAIIAVI